LSGNRFKILDLFAAPGGLSLGFEMAGFETLAGVDIDKRGIETYYYNFPHAARIPEENMDIQKLESQKLMEAAGVSKGEVDVIIGGPPCQGFSTIGRVKIASLVKEGIWRLQNSQPRFIDDPRNVLYKHFVRLVKDLEPAFFVMENVPGMKSYRNGEIVRQITEDLESLKYKVSSDVLDAVNYGVPQKRKRIFFVGTRLEKATFRWPPHTHYSPEKVAGGPLDEFMGSKLKPAVTVRDAIGDLPPLEAGYGVEEIDRPPIPPDAGEYQKWAARDAPKLYNHVARYHNERDLKVFSSKKFGEGLWWKDLPQEFRELYGYRDDIFHDKIKRLRRDRPSWTVVAHLYKDGYMYVHPTQPRTITVREAARLQSFPDCFRFMGSRTDQFKQVGNAVPPLLAKAVAKEVKRSLERALP